MMKVLIENNILKMEYDEERLFLKNTWYDESDFLEDEEYQQHILAMIEKVKEMKEIRYMLSDTSRFHYAISPDMQSWVAQRVFPILAQKKLLRSALMTTEDIFAQFSIEQLTDENKVAPIQRMYFTKEADALEWLLG